MKDSRRAFISMSALVASALAASAKAQYGGRPRDRSDSGAARSTRPGDASGPRAAVPPLVDPVIAIERELPSLRIDLKLTADQTSLFDSFERQVRNAAEAGRVRNRHLSAFRVDEGSTVTADVVLSTISGDDAERAEATRMALEKMTALYGVLTSDQRKQFDRRIIQSLREPLGNS